MERRRDGSSYAQIPKEEDYEPSGIELQQLSTTMYSRDEEEAQLRRAMELSLEESKKNAPITDKVINAVTTVKERFKDPYKGWVEPDQLAGSSEDSPFELSPEEEDDRRIALHLHDVELSYVEKNRTWVDQLRDINRNRYDLFYDSRRQYKPIFLMVVSAIQVVLFLTNLIVGGGFAPPADNPMLGPSAEALVMFGGNYQPYTKDQHEFWRLFTPIFLHAGIIHLILNLLLQWQVGFPLERVWGPWRIIPIYLISGIVGNIWTAIFNRTVSIGASGALMGLYGALVADNLVNWKVMRHAKRQIIFWVVTILIIFASGFVPMIDNWVHTMGMFAGFQVGFIVLECLIHNRPPWKRLLTRVGAAISLSLFIFAGLYLLYAVPTFSCPVCCYMVGKFNC